MAYFSRIILVFLLLGLCLRIKAQSSPPGYLGKRLTLFYGLNIGPAFSGANYNDRLWNQSHEFSLQYVLSTRWQMGLSDRIFRTIYDNRREIDSEGAAPKSYYKLSGHNLLWTFRVYKKGYVAPWGKYFEFGLSTNVVKTEYDAYMHIRKQVNNHDTLYSNFGPELRTFISPDIIAGWGRTRIYKDKFIVDYGWNTCLLALFGSVTDLVKAANTTYTFDNYIESTYKERLHGINRFNVYLRLGYLF